MTDLRDLVRAADRKVLADIVCRLIPACRASADWRHREAGWQALSDLAEHVEQNKTDRRGVPPYWCH